MSHELDLIFSHTLPGQMFRLYRKGTETGNWKISVLVFRRSVIQCLSEKQTYGAKLFIKVVSLHGVVCGFLTMLLFSYFINISLSLKRRLGDLSWSLY